MRTQQDILYAAESGAPEGQRFADLDELERWLHAEMLDQPWWHERFPKVKGIVVPRVKRTGIGSVGAWFDDDWTGQIEMSSAHWCAKYVCHEVAHVTSRAHADSTSHDPAFARDYLILVYMTMGSEAWMDLRSRLLGAGVVIDPRDDT